MADFVVKRYFLSIGVEKVCFGRKSIIFLMLFVFFKRKESFLNNINNFFIRYQLKSNIIYKNNK